MATLAHHFQEGGFPMYGILCFSMLGHPVALAALIATLVTKRRGFVIGVGAAALGFGVVTLGVGVLGYLYSMSIVDSVLMMADAGSREMLRAKGTAEAMNNIYFGVGAATLPALLGGLALLRGARMDVPKREHSHEL